MKSDNGLTMLELVTLLSVATLTLSAAATYSVPLISADETRNAAHTVQDLLQLTRVEAVSRGHDCRFRIDEQRRTVQVWDTAGTAESEDDSLLHQRILPSSVALANLTIESIGPPASGLWESRFSPRGRTPRGAGSIQLRGRGGSITVQLYEAGGTQVLSGG